MSVLLEVRNLTKTFPGVRALDDVSLTVSAGEVVALVGHNGSGKSTLVKVLAGVHAADAGEFVTGGTAGSHREGTGLHFIHQDLGLIPMLSAVENIDLVRPLGRRGWQPSPRRREREHARRLVERFSGRFDVDAPVSTLSPAERTIVAIARALDGWSSAANVLVLDEPTAALAEGEVRKLFDAVRAVVDEGAGVMLVSHRLDEVVEIADRVVVLRDGRVVASAARGELDQTGLARLIAGSDHAAELARARSRPRGRVVLEALNLRSAQLHGLDLEIREGEIVGVTGLLGSGMEHVGAAVFGALPGAAGRVLVDGTAVAARTPAASVRAGIGFAPADRRRFGAVLRLTARENITLPLLKPLRGRLGQIRSRAERLEAGRWMDRVAVRPLGAGERPFGLFSGGNQQKMVIGRWLRTAPRVLVLEEPTQGVDVGAQAGIHQLIGRSAEGGAAVLLCSSDAKELAALCHRVVVLHRGRATTTLEGADLTEAALVRATLVPPTPQPSTHVTDPSRGQS